MNSSPDPGQTVNEDWCLNGKGDKLNELTTVTDDKINGSEFDLEEKTMLDASMAVKIEDNSSPLQLRYGLLSSPPVLITLMAAIQHILLCISSALTTSQVVADSACAPYDHPVRSQLFCTTLCMVGVCTFLQTAVGVRLPVFQGPSSSFLVPLLALQGDLSWRCPQSQTEDETGIFSETAKNATINTTTTVSPSSVSVIGTDISTEIGWRLQTLSGSLMVAGILEVILGGLGLLKLLIRFVGPITVACTVSLIAVALVKVPLIYGRPCFPITIGCAVLVVIFILYLKDITLPLPRYGKKSTDKPRSRFAIFQLIPILLAIIVMWVLTWILTVTDVFSDDRSREDKQYLARTDAKLAMIDSSQWIQITYPGQFGAPRMNPAVITGFLVAFFTSTVESVGDYFAAQKACRVPRPPDHAICRGILTEGLGSVLSGAVGAGHATTSFSGNIALLSVSRTASRSIMYTAAILLIGTSLLGKVGAALTTVPNPVLGGVVVILIGTIFSIGMENLKHVDMASSRNMVVVGVPFMCGIMIPAALEKYPDIIDTGVPSLTSILKVMLEMPMFIGGFLALLLDNTVPGSLESRGMAVEAQGSDGEKDLTETEQDLSVYSWSFYPRVLQACPWLAKLPFMPKAQKTL